MRNSKYIGLKSGDWTCTYIGVARVQPTYLKGTKKLSKRPHHQNYYYIFERPTHDHKAEKMIRVSEYQVRRIADPFDWYNAEYVADQKKKKAVQVKPSFEQKVSYSFC